MRVGAFIAADGLFLMEEASHHFLGVFVHVYDLLRK
jgi:hypothetical protein